MFTETPFTADVFSQAVEYRELEAFPAANKITLPGGAVRSVPTNISRAIIDLDELSPGAFPEILQDGDLARLDSALQRISDLSSRFPASKKYLDPVATSLKLEKERFRRGEAKWANNWYPSRAAALEDRDRPARMLQEARAREAAMAQAQAEQMAAAAKARALEEEAARKTESEQLAAFHARAAALLQRASADKAWTQPLTDFARIVAPLEAVSQDLDKLAEEGAVLAQRIKSAEVKAALQRDLMNLAAARAWVRTSQSFAAGQVPAAAAMVREFLGAYQDSIPPSKDAIWGQINAAAQICAAKQNEARLHLEKAEELARAGRNTQAVIEYSAAQALFPDPDVTAKIQKLRKTSLGL